MKFPMKQMNCGHCSGIQTILLDLFFAADLEALMEFVNGK